MLALSEFEHSVRRVLTQHAMGCDPHKSAVDTLTYTDVGRLVDPEGTQVYPMTRRPFRGMHTTLGHVSMHRGRARSPVALCLGRVERDRHPGRRLREACRHPWLHRPPDARSRCWTMTTSTTRGILEGEALTFWKDEVHRVVAFWSAAAHDPMVVPDAHVARIMDSSRESRKQSGGGNNFGYDGAARRSSDPGTPTVSEAIRLTISVVIARAWRGRPVPR